MVLHELLPELHDEVLLLLQLDFKLDVVYRFLRLEILPFFLHFEEDLQVLLVLILLLSKAEGEVVLLLLATYLNSGLDVEEISVIFGLLLEKIIETIDLLLLDKTVQ